MVSSQNQGHTSGMEGEYLNGLPAKDAIDEERRRTGDACESSKNKLPPFSRPGVVLTGTQSSLLWRDCHLCINFTPSPSPHSSISFGFARLSHLSTCAATREVLAVTDDRASRRNINGTPVQIHTCEEVFCPHSPFRREPDLLGLPSPSFRGHRLSFRSRWPPRVRRPFRKREDGGASLLTRCFPEAALIVRRTVYPKNRDGHAGSSPVRVTCLM